MLTAICQRTWLIHGRVLFQRRAHGFGGLQLVAPPKPFQLAHDTANYPSDKMAGVKYTRLLTRRTDCAEYSRALFPCWMLGPPASARSRRPTRMHMGVLLPEIRLHWKIIPCGVHQSVLHALVCLGRPSANSHSDTAPACRPYDASGMNQSDLYFHRVIISTSIRTNYSICAPGQRGTT